MKIINDLNLKKQSEELGVSVWKTPGFLFLVLGFLIIMVMTGVQHASRYYDNPEMTIIAESIIVVVIFAVGNSIIREIEQMARMNKIKDEFISITSHQLRTPISSINWQTEVFLKKFKNELNEDQKIKIGEIAETSLKMTRLVNDLLDVARIDQGRFGLKKDPVDISAITKEVIDDFKFIAKAKNVEVVFDDQCEGTIINGDPRKIKLAIENLVSNSIKYTFKKGKVEIFLKKGQDSLFFEIKDSGVGIPEKQQERIFEKFFRSDNVVKYQTEGTGLGLYITKNVIEQLDGKIWFESREGIGTAFCFVLPILSPHQ